MYDALDRGNELAFFIITRDDGTEFFVEVDVGGPARVASPGFREELRVELERFALAGVSDTTQDGTSTTKTRLQAAGRSVVSQAKVYSGIFDGC